MFCAVAGQYDAGDGWADWSESLQSEPPGWGESLHPGGAFSLTP